MDCKPVKKNTLIFDFDGTVFFLFSNYDLADTCRKLESGMKDFGVDFSSKTDPFDVFETIRQQTKETDIRKKAFAAADEILADAEKEAAAIADPVPGAAEILPLLIEKGFKIGIATNNSRGSVLEGLHRILEHPDLPVEGRIGDQPEKMKPEPDSVLKVMNDLHADREETIFIGDTIRDLQAAQNCGADFVGMGPTERKYSRLKAYDPNIPIVKTFFELYKELTGEDIPS